MKPAGLRLSARWNSTDSSTRSSCTGRALDAPEIQAIFSAGSAERCQSLSGCVEWSSSTAAAAIDANGVATGQSAGVTTIAATSTAESAISGGTTLTVVNPNRAPIANAGPDQIVQVPWRGRRIDHARRIRLARSRR